MRSLLDRDLSIFPILVDEKIHWLPGLRLHPLCPCHDTLRAPCQRAALCHSLFRGAVSSLRQTGLLR